MAPYLQQKDSNGNGLRVGYMVDDHEHDKEPLDARLPLLQHADLEDKVVLLRVDHNVVKKGQILCRSPCCVISLCHQRLYSCTGCKVLTSETQLACFFFASYMV